MISRSGKAQDPLKDLQVSGTNIQFIFSSLLNYNNGIELNGWTRLKIKYKYTGKNGWQLLVRANDTHLRYEGDASNDIPVGNLELISSVTSSDDATTVITNPFNTSDLDQILVTGDGGDPNQVNVDIIISYRIGFPPNAMINKPEGLYFVTLRFLLVEIN